MAKVGKKYADSVKLIEKNRLYDTNEALALVCQTAKAKFEQELNERIQMTVNTMMENKEWREILSHLSQEAKVKIISMVFLSTAVKEGSEQAFAKAVMSLNK